MNDERIKDKFWCSETQDCADRRTLDAEHRGKVMTKLDNIEKSVSALWDEMVVNRQHINRLYFRIGLISGGTSLIVSLVVSLVLKGL